MASSLATIALVIASLSVFANGRVIREVPDPHSTLDEEEETVDKILQFTDNESANYYDSWNSDSLLPKNYNKLLPPITGSGEPVVVKIGLNVTQLLAIKEDEQVRRTFPQKAGLFLLLNRCYFFIFLASFYLSPCTPVFLGSCSYHSGVVRSSNRLS